MFAIKNHDPLKLSKLLSIFSNYSAARSFVSDLPLLFLCFFNASLSKNSICPFKLRKSCCAQASSSLSISGFTRNANAFFSARSGVQSSSVQNGCCSRSPHKTTSKLLTMAAFRSSSRCTIPFSESIDNAISTIPTAPFTI